MLFRVLVGESGQRRFPDACDAGQGDGRHAGLDEPAIDLLDCLLALLDRSRVGGRRESDDAAVRCLLPHGWLGEQRGNGLGHLDNDLRRGEGGSRAHVLLRGRGGDGKKPLKEADDDPEDGKDDQQATRPGTTHDALAVQDPQGRAAQQEEERDPQDEEAPLSELLALAGFRGCLFLLLC